MSVNTLTYTKNRTGSLSNRCGFVQESEIPVILKKAFAYFFLFLDTAASATRTITEPAIVDIIITLSPVCGEDVTLEVEPFLVVFLVVAAVF